jgi:large subunit ribosomal protein L6
MSRIGKAPIALTGGVTVTVSADNVVTVKGPKGELQQAVDRDIIIEQEEGNLLVKRPSDQKTSQSAARFIPLAYQ